MKRSIHEITNPTTMKTSAALNTIKASPRPRKQAKLVLPVFDWLPEEVLLPILKGLPWQLDGITRLVCRTWWAVINDRWNPRCRHSLSYVVPCARWALKNQVHSILRWLAVDMEAILDYKEARKAWLGTACRAGNAKTITWLTSKKAPKRIRCQATSDHVNLVAESGDLDCYKMILKASDRGGGRVSAEDMYRACEGGQQQTLEWIYNKYMVQKSMFYNYPKPSLLTCLGHASGHGHLELMGWLLDHAGDEKWMGNHKNFPGLLRVALQGGDHEVSVLNWMWAHAEHMQTLAAEIIDIVSPRDFLMQHANGKTCLPGLRWLQAHGVAEAEAFQSNEEACFDSRARRLARYGELEVLRWMHEYKFVRGLEKARIWDDDNSVILRPSRELKLEGSRLLIEQPTTTATAVSE